MNYSDFGMDTASLAGSLESKLAAVRGAGFSQVMISAARRRRPPGGRRGRRARDPRQRPARHRSRGAARLRGLDRAAARLQGRRRQVDAGDLRRHRRPRAAGRGVDVDARRHRPRRDRARPAQARGAGDPAGHPDRLQGTVVEPHGAATSAPPATSCYRANCPNLGLAIDAFDVLAAGVPLDDLDAIDPEQIFLVQLSDYMWQEIALRRGAGRRPPRTSASSPARARTATRWPTFVTRLDALGYYGDYSFDVYNDDYLQMPPETVAARALRAAEWLGETVLRRTLPVPNMERLLRRTRRLIAPPTPEAHAHCRLPPPRRQRPRGLAAVPRHDELRRPHRRRHRAADRRLGARRRRQLHRHRRRLRRRRVRAHRRRGDQARPAALDPRHQGRQRADRSARTTAGCRAAGCSAPATTASRAWRTDYIDIYYLHRDDPGTPIAETVGAIGDLIRAGKIRYFGVSNFRGWRIAEVVNECEAQGVPPPVVCQPYYNLLNRMPEVEVLPACDHYGIGVAPYSPTRARRADRQVPRPAAAARRTRARRSSDSRFMETEFRAESFAIAAEARAARAEDRAAR